MWSSMKDWFFFKFPVKVADLEATLKPEPSFQTHGEIEYSVYSNGARSLEVEVEGLPPGESGTADLDFGDGGSCSIPVVNGRVASRVDTRRGHNIPEINQGDRVAMRYRGDRVLSGVFDYD